MVLAHQAEPSLGGHARYRILIRSNERTSGDLHELVRHDSTGGHSQHDLPAKLG